MERFHIVLLLLAGLGFLGFGLWLCLDTAGGLAPVDIAATSAAGLIELRAFYGGLELGLGAFLLLCARHPHWRSAGLALTLLANGGIGAMRLAGIASTGVFTPFFAAALAWELGFALLAGIGLAVRPRQA